ncbi:MAG: zf-HC2 domain-containing protein [Myxococcota bacterium]|jgi:anti-sigma factor RsiW|nr:zf-HC2 domain-containing protein [Myxococcota bacterium]
MTKPVDHAYFEQLLMKAVDGVLSAKESALFQQHLAECEACRAEYVDFVAIKESTNALSQRVLLDRQIEPRPMGGVVLVATALMLLAFLTMAGMALHRLWLEDALPPVFWLGLGFALLSVAMFAFIAVRSRVRGLRRDPYQDIEQ